MIEKYLITAFLIFVAISVFLILLAIFSILPFEEKKKPPLSVFGTFWGKLTTDNVYLSRSLLILTFGVFVFLYWLVKPKLFDFLGDILVEMGGVLFDVAILVLLFNWLNEKGEKKKTIQSLKDEIDDFRDWDEKEAMFRIVGAIKRLSKLGITKIDLSNCFLKNAILDDLILDDSNLNNANLNNASLIGACLHRSELCYAHLQSATLTEANLEFVNLHLAKMENAILCKANLQHADLHNAFMENANLENADLRKANFGNVKLKGAILEGAILTGATVDSPDFFDNLLVVGIEKIRGKYYIDLQPIRGPYPGKFYEIKQKKRLG